MWSWQIKHGTFHWRIPIMLAWYATPKQTPQIMLTTALRGEDSNNCSAAACVNTYVASPLHQALLS
jgi:hypothetical protein